MNTLSYLFRGLAGTLLSLLLVGHAVAYSELNTTYYELSDSVKTAARGHSSIGDLTLGEGVTQCAANERKLRTISTLSMQQGLRAGITSLTIGSSDPANSYHCCDGEGNCSDPVDALTICPVIKVWCRYDSNQCICD